MNFKEYALTESAIQKIAKLTDRNSHVEARIEGAKYLKNKKLADAYTGIQAVLNLQGDLSSHLSALRNELDKDYLFKQAKMKLSEEDYNDFYQAF